MKNVLAAIVFFCLLSITAIAQDNTLRPRQLGVAFILNDFATAQRIRNGSITTVLGNKKWAKFNEMAPGLALSYFKGLTRYIDFSGTLGASFANYSLPDKPAFSSDALLLEADASANFKMFDESYWVTPYLSAGAGISKYRSYYGALIPLGLGIKVNLFDEAAVYIGSQYRIPIINETGNYHFQYSIGITGNIGK
jgi:hypothetical protein